MSSSRNLCFWVGLLNKLSNDDFQYAFNQNKPNIDSFINLLIDNNKYTKNIKWQNQSLSNNELKENYQHIHDFNKNTINKGYYCSSCDPFLLLITQLFNIELIHQYCGNSIIYTSNNPRKKLNYFANSHHFW
jgi:hypothetical protein